MIYSQILNSVFDVYSSNQSESEFLRSLQGYLDILRGGYQDEERCKCVRYDSKPTQACYLLVYLPPYLKQTEHALKRAAERSSHVQSLISKRNLSLALLGCGPMPEAIAVSNLCKGSRLNITCLDLNAKLWHPAHKVTCKLIENNCSITDRLTFDCDLGHPDSLPPEKLRYITQADIVILQNCCNELDDLQKSQLSRHLQRVLAELKPGSILMINDVARYKEVEPVMSQTLASPYIPRFYEKILDDRLSKATYVNFKEDVPLSLQRNLFIHDPKMRLSAKKHIHYRALCLMRKEIV